MKQDWFSEIERWNEKYFFNFQFWPKNNSVYIYKEGADNLVEVHSTGGYDTAEEVIKEAFSWVYRVNRVPKQKRVIV